MLSLTHAITRHSNTESQKISRYAPSDLDLWPTNLKMLCQLFLTWVTYPLSMKVVWFSVFAARCYA